MEFRKKIGMLPDAAQKAEDSAKKAEMDQKKFEMQSRQKKQTAGSPAE